jgi:N-acetylglucosamine malate deacetylase 1
MTTGRVDVLGIGAHPDDVEACAGGLLIKAKKYGWTTGILDLTRGEGSNFGTVEERAHEAAEASKILKLDYRGNLGVPDMHVGDTEDAMPKLVSVLRELRPKIILLPYFADLHPDHAATGQVGNMAAFMAKIARYLTPDGKQQPPHQVSLTAYYMLHTEFNPSFVLDVSEEHQTKMRSIHAHRSQFFKKDEASGEYTQDYHNPEFLEFFEARSRVYGYKIGVRFGEPFLIKGYLGLRSLEGLMSGDGRSLVKWSEEVA